MNAGGHAARKSRVPSHIQRASEKQAHCPPLMRPTVWRTVVHAATLSRTQSPVVTLCNEVLVQVCAAWVGTARPAAGCTGVARDTLRATRKRPAFTMDNRHPRASRPGYVAPSPKSRSSTDTDDRTRAQGLTVGLPASVVRTLAVLKQRSMHPKAFTQASTWLHKQQTPCPCH